MKRILLSLLIFFMLSACIWADSSSVKLTISNVSVEKGSVYLAVYNSKETYKNKDYFMVREIPGASETVTLTIDVPYGEYVFSLFQDENSNGKLDTKIFGIPKEKVGISNYKGKGIPGGFDSLKLTINTATVSVPIILIEI